jgi:nicotinate-nucleotide adenylyltransferase
MAQASIGILGGTFNPPHVGHLALARHARTQLGLQRVLLMPANSSPHKRRDQDPGAAHRLRMCELATAADEGLSACALELERPAPSYTVETLEQLRAKHPERRWTFIAGADVAATLPSWRRPRELLELARLAVATRPGSSCEHVSLALAALLGAAAPERELARRVSFIEMPAVDVSSSQVRERLARGEPVDELVGPRVARYIAEQRLYASREVARP